MSNISIRSVNYPDRFIRHLNFLCELTTVQTDLDKQDATFEIVPGLADGRLISFRSINFPSHYLRHQNYRLKLQENLPSPDSLFAKDATFIMKPGNADVSAVSFTSFNLDGWFIRHSGFHLTIEQLSDDLSRKDTTFVILKGFIEARSHV